ncbi:MAG: DUF484 family protein [Betaproteobacteria bacterium]|nr:DUF484 family protein [Betaproteobacteria bacterium]
MSPEEVARFLRSNPGFFEHHADLLATIQVPHPHGGRAIPLSERQLVALRDRNRSLEGKLGELIQFGEENDTIGAKVHALAVILLRVTTLDGVLGCLYGSLHDDFAVPHVAIRLWRGTGEQTEFAPIAESQIAYATNLVQPFCGPSEGMAAAIWLSGAADHVRSYAMVPLRDAEGTFGLIALGSEEPRRFFPDMGTLYLSRIGELVSAMLGRLL